MTPIEGLKVARDALEMMGAAAMTMDLVKIRIGALAATANIEQPEVASIEGRKFDMHMLWFANACHDPYSKIETKAVEQTRNALAEFIDAHCAQQVAAEEQKHADSISEIAVNSRLIAELRQEVIDARAQLAQYQGMMVTLAGSNSFSLQQIENALAARIEPTPADEWPEDAEYALGHLAAMGFGSISSAEIGHCVGLIRDRMVARIEPAEPAAWIDELGHMMFARGADFRIGTKFYAAPQPSVQPAPDATLINEETIQVPAQTGTVTWAPVATLPDADETVMIFCAESNEPVWPGYFDGVEWFSVEGDRVKPTHWQAMPEGPKP